eukprot:2164083-Alexandrium_andersonii.AAC.1
MSPASFAASGQPRRGRASPGAGSCEQPRAAGASTGGGGPLPAAYDRPGVRGHRPGTTDSTIGRGVLSSG